MAIGTDVIKTTGRLIFDLARGGETTTRAIDIPYPLNEDENIQTAVNSANSLYTSVSNQMNVFVQPANWRDNNITEEQWTTTRVYYEQVTVMTHPIEPDTE